VAGFFASRGRPSIPCSTKAAMRKTAHSPASAARSNHSSSGIFHVTGGLRLSRISQLIKTLFSDHPPSVEVANRAEATPRSFSNYKSVVALVALQISDLVNGTGIDGRSAKRNVSVLSRTDLGQALAKASKVATRNGFINDVLSAAKVLADTPLFSH